MNVALPFLSVALLLTGSIVGESQSPAAASPSSGNARISLSIATKQSTYKTGEKILINIVMKNVSDEEYCENHVLETGEAELNGYHTDVSGPNGETPPLTPREREKGMRSRGKLCIAQGETIKESLFLDRLVDLSGLGVYQVSVDHVDRGNKVRVSSNRISVTITP